MDMVINFESGGMPHKREFARISTAWKKAKAQLEVKTSTETLQRQHRKLMSRSTGRRIALAVLLRRFPRGLSAGMLRADPLDQVISLAEAELQDIQRPDAPRQLGIHLNAQLTLQTSRASTTVPGTVDGGFSLGGGTQPIDTLVLPSSSRAASSILLRMALPLLSSVNAWTSGQHTPSNDR